MSAIKLSFATIMKSEATFDGVVESTGASTYKFSGTLKAKCWLERGAENFGNVVRVGYGGTSGDYTYLDFDLGKKIAAGGAFAVSGNGSRASNEAIDFRLGFNEKTEGGFLYSDKTTVALSRSLEDSQDGFEFC